MQSCEKDIYKNIERAKKINENNIQVNWIVDTEDRWSIF